MQDKNTLAANSNENNNVVLSDDSEQHPNFKNTRHHISWPSWEEDVAELTTQLNFHGNPLDRDYQFVYGIPRGGLTLATQLSHRLGIPLVSDAPGYWMLDWYHWRMKQGIELKSNCKNILIADAICDTGATIDYVVKDFMNAIRQTKDPDQWSITFCAVDVDPSVIDKVDYYVNIKNPKQWYVYPWEIGSQELLSL